MTSQTLGDSLFTPLLLLALTFILYRAVRGALWHRAAHHAGGVVVAVLVIGVVLLAGAFTLFVFPTA